MNKFFVLLGSVSLLFFSTFILPVGAQTKTQSPKTAVAPALTKEQFDALSPQEQADFLKTLPNAQVKAQSATSAGGVGQRNDMRIASSSPNECVAAYGSVQVQLTPNLSSTVPGAPMVFSGVIKNNNETALVDGQVYVKIFYKGAQSAGMVNKNGYDVIDQALVLDHITLKGHAETPITFSWKVPLHARGGEYQLATFYTLSNRFNMSGLTFTDDITGSTASFTVVSKETTGLSYFDKQSVTINKKPFAFAAFPPTVGKDEKVVVTATLVNPQKTPTAVSVSWVQYSWDFINKDFKRKETQESIYLKGKEHKVVTHELYMTDDPVVFTEVIAKEQDSSSLLNIRFVREGIALTRNNLMLPSAYPLKAGVEETLLGCIHAMGTTPAKDALFTMTLRDTNENVIESYSYAGDVSSSVMSLKKKFTLKKDLVNFSLTATLEQPGRAKEEVRMMYACADIDPTLCVLPPPPATDAKGLQTLLTVLGLVAFGGLLFAARHIYNAKHTAPLALIAATIMVGASFFGMPQSSEAAAQPKIIPVNLPHFLIDGSGTCKCQVDVDASFNYSATLLNVSTGLLVTDGDILPVGTKLRLVPKPYDNTDISWFGAGNFNGSPYGSWNAKALYTGVGEQLIDTGVNGGGDGSSITANFSAVVNPPTPQATFGGTATYSCTDTFNCTVLTPGTVTAVLTFPETYFSYYTTGFAYNPGPGSWVYNWQTNATNFVAGLADPYPYPYLYYDLSSDPYLYATYPQFHLPPDTFTSVPLTAANAPGYFQLANMWYYQGLSNWFLVHDATANVDFISWGVSGVTGKFYSPVNFSGLIPSQSVSYALTAASVGAAPITPVVSVDAPSKLTATPFNFTAQTTDPDTDQIAYVFDYNGDGIVDERAPIAGFVPSGVSQVVSHSWNTAGSYTIKAAALDSNGNMSGWSLPLTVLVTNLPSPSITLTSISSLKSGVVSASPWNISAFATENASTKTALITFSTGNSPTMCNLFKTTDLINPVDTIASPAPTGNTLAPAQFTTAGTFVFRVVCTNVSGSVSSPDITYTVVSATPPLAVQLNADKASPIIPKSKFNLSWTVIGVPTGCQGSISNGIDSTSAWVNPTDKSVSGGSMQVTMPTVAQTYTITCTDGVNPPQQSSLSFTTAFKIGDGKCEGNTGENAVNSPIDCKNGQFREVVQ